jgi:hypothetical protein
VQHLLHTQSWMNDFCALCFVALGTGCTTSAPTSPVTDAATADVHDAFDDRLPALPHPVGRWAAGDLHVHSTGASNDTRGQSFPADIARVARSRGLSWVVLTDHSNSTGSDVNTRSEDPARFNRGPEFPYADVCAQLSVPGVFVMVDGNEVSPVWSLDNDAGVAEPRGHLGCIPPADLAGFRARTSMVAFTDRPPGAVRGGDNIAAIHSLGAWAVLNHPHSVAPHIAYDWSSFEYDAVEVWNGTAGYDPGDEAARLSWLCDLASGRNVVLVGGSDCHETAVAYPGGATNPALGFPTTSVYTSEVSWNAIAGALRAGHVTVHSAGSFVALWMARDAMPAAMPGDRVTVRTSETLTFEMEGTAAVAMTVSLWRTAAGTCRDTRRAGTSVVPAITPERVFETNVSPGVFRVFARVPASAGVSHLHAELHAQGAAGFETDVGLTHAIRVNGE